MTTRRSLRSAPVDLPAPRIDAENEPAQPVGKQTLATKQKLGKPRAALIDLSNAIEKGKKNITKLGVRKGRVHRVAGQQQQQQSGDSTQQAPRATDAQPRGALKPRAGVKRSAAGAAADGAVKKARKLRSIPTLPDLRVSVSVTRLAEGSSSTSQVSAASSSLASITSEETTGFETPPEGNSPESERAADLVSRLNAENERRTSALPEGVIDFDSEAAGDIFAVPEYVNDLFRHYKEREAMCQVAPYLGTVQTDLTEMMRSILVDWMVEVQESFELNHETLYLAVRLVDLYLAQVEVSRETLQLVGATAIFIACKFDERLPPPLDDFLYICEDAYARREIIATEMKILRTVNFDVGLPVSYRFLRRYARCCKLPVEVLTLARYVLELSLMEYQFVSVAGSRLAAAALALAVHMRMPGHFEQIKATVEYFSGYSVSEFQDLTEKLHNMLGREPNPHLKTIRAKYSHQVFHKVACIPLLRQAPSL
ncbi:G2/mitotic-specific cyclin-B3 [Amphibalanus amphitrite]|uniref:G2/mitotic-specific cyclin-B3 n=1 Tax=Amphibalanus amphitrite TaxID=1232801 RepID=A0A6A4VNI9_AMPAM|nr:G2/mitotic-specific cyclin-B3 [Amphibalanus amphitrite]